MLLQEVRNRKFTNGTVYMLNTEDGFPIEVTDTFYLITQKTVSMSILTN